MREGRLLKAHRVGKVRAVCLVLTVVMMFVMPLRTEAGYESFAEKNKETTYEDMEALKSSCATRVRVTDVRDSSKISEIALDVEGNIMGDGDYHLYVWFNANKYCEDTYNYMLNIDYFMKKIEEYYPVTVFVNRQEPTKGWMLQELEERSEIILKDDFTIVDVQDNFEQYSSIMQKLAGIFNWDLYSTELVCFVVSPNGKYHGRWPCDPSRDARSPELTSFNIGAAFSMAGRGNWYSATEIEDEDKPLSFADVKKGDWQYPFVKYIVQNGVMSGKKTDGTGVITFDPNANMTRAEFVQALYNKEGKPAVTYTGRFKDVSAGKWYTNATLWAATNGIVSGTGEGGAYFDVNGNITREQVATILCNYATNYKKYDTSGREAEKFSQFTDKGKTSSWAIGNIQWALHYNILKGKGQLLDPQGFATRAECATMLKNFIFTYE